MFIHEYSIIHYINLSYFVHISKRSPTSLTIHPFKTGNLTTALAFDAQRSPQAQKPSVEDLINESETQVPQTVVEVRCWRFCASSPNLSVIKNVEMWGKNWETSPLPFSARSKAPHGNVSRVTQQFSHIWLPAVSGICAICLRLKRGKRIYLAWAISLKPLTYIPTILALRPLKTSSSTTASHRTGARKKPFLPQTIDTSTVKGFMFQVNSETGREFGSGRIESDSINDSRVPRSLSSL